MPVPKKQRNSMAKKVAEELKAKKKAMRTAKTSVMSTPKGKGKSAVAQSKAKK